MLSFRSHQLAFFFIFHCLLLAIVPAYAIPVALKRQDDSEATTVMTQTTTTTLAGEMTQTCVITLTPITDDQGNPAVRQVRTCTVTMKGLNNGSDTGNTGGTNEGDNTGTNEGDSTTSTDSSGDSQSKADSGSSSTAAEGSESTSSAAGGPIANGASKIARPSSTATDSAGSGGGGNASASGSSASSAATESSSSGSGGNAGSGGAAISANGVSTVTAPSGTNAAGAGPTPATAAEQQAAPSESTSFTVPGQKIQVLPIGLGVFAGISVIALIVVGLVTYERTKYRKAFRARKLAEAGAGMGYGGMAQRS